MAVKKTTSTSRAAAKIANAIKAEPAKAAKTAAKAVKEEEKTAVKAEEKAEVKASEKAPVKAEPEKKEAAKAIETKKDTTKKLETKAAVLVDTPETEEKAAVKKSVKAPAKAEKKAPVKKAASKKAELKTEMFLQFAGKEYTDKEIFDKIKYVWSKVLKNKVGDMKDVKIYLKPEESAAYYVINGDTTGKVDLKKSAILSVAGLPRQGGFLFI